MSVLTGLSRTIATRLPLSFSAIITIEPTRLQQADRNREHPARPKEKAS